MERPPISPGFVEDALGCLDRRGLEPRPLLIAASIDPALLGPVSNLQYGKLWLAIADRIGGEFFDEAARPMRPGSFRLLCQVTLHAHGLRRALSFLAVVLDDPAGELHQRDGQAEILLLDRERPRRAFAYRTYGLVLLGVMCWLIDRRMPLLRIDFSCPAPLDCLDYHLFFGAPVHFDQPVSRLSFAASYLSLPIIRARTTPEQRDRTSRRRAAPPPRSRPAAGPPRPAP